MFAGRTATRIFLAVECLANTFICSMACSNCCESSFKRKEMPESPVEVVRMMV